MAKSTGKNIKDKTKAPQKGTTAKKTVAKKITKKTRAASVKKTTPVEKVTKKTQSGAAKKATATKKAVTAKNKATAASTGNYKPTISVKEALKSMKGYGKRDLAKFKKVIMAKREDIIKQLQALKDQMMDSSTGQYVNENSPYSLHMAEQGTDAQEREKLYLWAQRENKFLGYLDDALQRIENGTYGICIDSINNPDETPHLVPKERLFAVPHTQHCVACKMKKNKNRR